MPDDGDVNSTTDQFLVDIAAEMAQTNSSSVATETSALPLGNLVPLGVLCSAEFDWNESSQLYPGEFRRIPIWEFVIKTIMYIIVIVTSLFGNVAVVLVVWRNKRMRTATNYFFVNLAISDLMVTSSCTWVHLVDDMTDGWVLGSFFCKFNSFAQVLSLVSSILTLTLVSCDRFFGIVFAMKARVTERRSAVLIGVVWASAVAVSLPVLVYRQQLSRRWLDHTEIWCGDEWPAVRIEVPDGGGCFVRHPSRVAYYSFVSSVLFFMPVAVMSVTYGLVIWKLWSSKRPGEILAGDTHTQDRIRKRIVVMLVVLLSVFAVCWLPYQIAILYAEHRSNSDQELPDWYSTFFFCANYMAFTNSALNPIIYTWFNENFRRGFKNLFFCRRTTEVNTTAVCGRALGCHMAMIAVTAPFATSATMATGSVRNRRSVLVVKTSSPPYCVSYPYRAPNGELMNTIKPRDVNT